MSLVFDKHTEELYRAWQLSSPGRSIEKELEKVFVKLLSPQKGERVLDIGCGTGNHLLILHRLGLNITGIDASSYMISKARERLGHRSTLVTGPGEDLPFEDNEFDITALINTLEFVKDPVRILMEAGRVTRKKVFIGILNGFSWYGLVKKMKGLFGDPLFSRARLYNIWQLKSMLHGAFGQCPTSWVAIRTRPHFMENSWWPGREAYSPSDSPFVSFLGVSVKMVTGLKTDNLPIKIKFKAPGRSLADIKTMGDLNRLKGVQKDERGLSL